MHKTQVNEEPSRQSNTRFLLFASLLAGLCIARDLPAQRLIAPPTRDCRLTRSAYDNPFSDGSGYWQPRIAWHAEYAALSLAVAYTIHRVTHLPPMWSAAVTTLGLGLLPHIRGSLINDTYPVHSMDWAFDVWNRGTPFVWAVGRDRGYTKPALVWLAGYAGLACWAEP
jgi:hypothetical protein